MRLCEGWYQALEVSRRLIAHGEYEHARHNLLSIKRFVTMFAAPDALAQLPLDHRAEIRLLLRELAATWHELAAAAGHAAAVDQDRLAS